MSLLLGGIVVDTPGLDVAYGPSLPKPLTWPEGVALVSKRLAPPDLGVIHATGGERGAEGIFQTLSAARRGKGYSVHFALERSGRVVQYLDPLVWTAAHCGGLNDRSVGIEVANSMYPAGSVAGRSKSEGVVQVVGAKPGALPNDFKTLKDGTKLWYRRSNRKPCMGLLPLQLAALRLLTRYLSEHTAIPHMRADSRDYVPVAERAALRGWVGHSAVTLGHGDPSMDSLDLLFW